MNDYLAAKSGGFHPPARADDVSLPTAYGNSDPFLAHGMSGGTRAPGKFLRVPAGSNGEFTYKGENDELVVPRGTEMLVAVGELSFRAVRWEGSKIVDQISGYLKEGFKLPRRETLGHTDVDAWERDEAGRPRDPWKMENLLPMKRISDGELFTAFISAKGSPDDAVRHLVLSYGRTDRSKYPVVKLGRDSFVSKRNGHRSWFPTLPLTGIWVPKAEFATLETGEPAVKVDRAPHRGYAPQRDYQAPVDAEWGQDDPGPAEIPEYIR